MDIEIYDNNMNRIGIVQNYNSFRYLEKYNNVGEFELLVRYTKENIELLKQNNFIKKTDSESGGIIQFINIKDESIEVRGKLTSYLLEDRIIKDTSYIKNIENDMRTVINNNCIIGRPIKNFALGKVNNVIDTTDKQVTHDTCLKCLVDLGIGFKVIFDRKAKKHLFEIYKGKDLSDSILFSEEFDNIFDNEITLDNSSYKNFAYVYGEGEGELRKSTTVDLRIDNEEIKELYVDAKDLQQEELSDEEYIKLLKTRGKEKLLEAIKEQSFTCKIKADGNYVYKKDYNIGDLVICKSSRFGVKFKVRIMSIQEIYDFNGYSIVAEIGDLKEVYNG